MDSGTETLAVFGTWITASVADKEALDELSTVAEARSERTVAEIVVEGPTDRVAVEASTEDLLSFSCRRTAW